MGHYKTLLAVLIALTAASPVSAGFFKDGNWLHSNCQKETSDVGKSLCLSYIVGVIDGSDAVHKSLYCWPERATTGQALDIVKKWLEENPALRTMSGGQIVVSALKEAFPTTVMWQPPLKEENDGWTVLPLTPEKSTDEGKWVATCNGKYQYGFPDVIKFTDYLPANYAVSKGWSLELVFGPE